MNQILKPKIDVNNENINKNNQKNVKMNSRINKFYRLQFLLSFILAYLFIMFLLIHILKINRNEKISKKLMSIYNVSTLYSNTINYSTNFSEDSSNLDSDSFIPFVIGMIKIDKINLNYPILSESNKELLDISLCRFAGPMPNEIGNLCIAGHNYVDYKFFSRLNELEINDTIKIYDLSGKMVQYKIYQKYETEATDMSCTSQNTNEKTIITLLTCNNISGKRLVLVAEPF